MIFYEEERTSSARDLSSPMVADVMGYPWSLFYISKLLDKPSLSFEKSFQKLVPPI
jgi:hypothetical protein